MEDAFKKTPSFSSHTVYIWVLDWSNYLNQKVHLWDILCPLEKKKASQFLFSYDKSKYVVIRGLLRILIGNFLKLSPSEFRFEYNLFGKPTLIDNSLEFNLSHSNHQVVYVFSKNASLGVDIEYLGLDKKIDLLAKRYFSSDENKRLAALSEKKKTKAFFTGWAQKEAIAKAFGLGLKMPFQEIEVSLDESLNCLNLPSPYLIDLPLLQLHSIKVEEKFISALAIKTNSKKIVFEKHTTLEM